MIELQMIAVALASAGILSALTATIVNAAPRREEPETCDWTALCAEFRR